jgi:hypothetical protein
MWKKIKKFLWEDQDNLVISVAIINILMIVTFLVMIVLIELGFHS